MKKYPDIAPLIKKKDEHRRRMASLPFEEKVRIAFDLNKRHKFIKSGHLVQPAESTAQESPSSDKKKNVAKVE